MASTEPESGKDNGGKKAWVDPEEYNGEKGSGKNVDFPAGHSEPLDCGALFFVLFCTLVAALGPFSFGYTIGYTSPALPEMASDLSLSVGRQSVFSAIVSVGAMVGAVSGGKLADFFGRRAALALAAIPFTMGWGIIAVSYDIVMLCVGRLFTGFATGVVSFAVPVYIAEIAPMQLRGRLGAVNQLAIASGVLLVYAFGVVLDWRALAIIAIYPAVLLLLGLSVLPESPRWLARRGSAEQVEAVLYRLRGSTADIGPEMREIQKAVEASESQPGAKMGDLAHPSLRRPLLVGVGLLVFQQFTGVNAVMFYAGSIFSAVGFTDPNVPGLLLQGVQVATTVVSVGLMDRAGRRLLLIISATFMAVGAIAMGISFQMSETADLVSASEVLAFVSMLVYVAAFSIGLGAVPWIIMSEIFPAHVRELAGSFAVLANWLSCFVVTLTFEDLLEWSSAGAFWMFACVCTIIVVFVAFLVPETRGRTLEEIEESFSRPLELDLQLA